MSFTLHHGDGVGVMREKIGARSIDMVYSDPPFGNEQVWKGKAGSFDDRWDASDASRRGWNALQQHSQHGAAMVAAACLGDKKTLAYIGTMAGLIVEIHRTLKLTGTLWLHFDDTMGAHLRILCDAVFGPANAIGTMIWKRSQHHSNADRFGRIHDTIACYGRSQAARWRLWRLGKLVGDPVADKQWSPTFADFATAAPLGQSDKERVGYPTQKPVALLTELIEPATLEGDTVLDPTCGSGTTLVAALGLDRNAIGIDASADAIAAARKRVDTRPAIQRDLFGAVA